MKTVVLDPLPAEVEQLLEHRRRLGLDHHDEVWEAVYHLNPAPRPRHAYLVAELARTLRSAADEADLVETSGFNLGDESDFRVPDHGYHRGMPDLDAGYLPTAAIVVEIVSPGDETWEKLPFYAAHHVDELMIIEPPGRRVRLLTFVDGRYVEGSESAALGLTVDSLEASIRWA